MHFKKILVLLILLIPSGNTADHHVYPTYGIGPGDSVQYFLEHKISNNSVTINNPINLRFFGDFNITILLYDGDIFTITFGEYTPGSQTTPELIAARIDVNGISYFINNAPATLFNSVNDWSGFAQQVIDNEYQLIDHPTEIGYIDMVYFDNGQLEQTTNYTIIFNRLTGMVTYFELSAHTSGSYEYNYLVRLVPYSPPSTTSSENLTSLTSSSNNPITHSPTTILPTLPSSNPITTTPTGEVSLVGLIGFGLFLVFFSFGKYRGQLKH